MSTDEIYSKDINSILTILPKEINKVIYNFYTKTCIKCGIQQRYCYSCNYYRCYCCDIIKCFKKGIKCPRCMRLVILNK